MLVSLENSQKNLNEIDICDFERDLSIKLPEDYKSFLLKYNGGKPTPRKFETVDKRFVSRIMFFFPITDAVTNNLTNIYLSYKQDNKFPRNLLPIGEDPINNLICISIQGKDSGSVYFWNKDDEDDKQLQYKYFSLISDSFSKFIEILSE